ncbi:MAG: sulfotransferase [Nitrospirae bacterium]|nr:sulfotransferase [Nitrospirota bacterium]
MARPPVFIGGFRSGSTLLINYLGLHPQISAVYETKFLVDLLRILRLLLNENGRGKRELELIEWWVENPALSSEMAVELLIQRAIGDISLTQKVLDGATADGKASHEFYVLGSNHILWKESEALETISAFLSAVRSKNNPRDLIPLLASGIQKLFLLHAGREGKGYWINKTPEILRFQPELRRMFGRIKSIHLIRDGRDVVNSSVNLNWWSVEKGSRSWKLFIEDVRAEASLYPEDYLELRFEEFVADHVGTLKRVLDFLEIEGDPAGIVALQKRHASGGAAGEDAKSRFWECNSQMSESDKAIFKSIANGLLVSLGYTKDAGW